VIRKILIISILISLLKNAALASERVLTAEDSVKINNLFEKNNITNDDCQSIERFIDDQYSTNIWCGQFYRNLPVIWGSLLYTFDPSGTLRKGSKGSKDSYNDKLSSELNIDIDPTIPEKEAISTFIDSAKMRDKNITSTTAIATLGIYNKNSGMSYTQPDYKLIWYVKFNKKYPFAIIDATSGIVYYYDNGIRR